MPITVTSEFKPLTYDDITKPLIAQTEAQRELEDTYSTASTEAATLMAQANQQTDPVAYERLKNYATSIQQQADNLLQRGLNRGSRNSLMNIRKQYANEIVPVQSAIGKRNTLSEEQRKLRVENPDLMFERNMNNVSIDAIMNNPNMDYGRSVSGKELTDRVATAAAAVANGIASVTNGGYFDKYTEKVIKESGFSPEQVMQAINTAVENGQSTDNILIQIRDGVLRQSGVMDWGDADTQARAIDYANEGLYKAVGKKDISLHTDQDAVFARQEQMKIDKENRAAARNAEKEKEVKFRYLQRANFDTRQGVLNSALQKVVASGKSVEEAKRIADIADNMLTWRANQTTNGKVDQAIDDLFENYDETYAGIANSYGLNGLTRGEAQALSKYLSQYTKDNMPENVKTLANDINNLSTLDKIVELPFVDVEGTADVKDIKDAIIQNEDIKITDVDGKKISNVFGGSGDERVGIRNIGIDYLRPGELAIILTNGQIVYAPSDVTQDAEMIRILDGNKAAMEELGSEATIEQLSKVVENSAADLYWLFMNRNKSQSRTDSGL